MADVAQNINFLKTTWLILFDPKASALITAQRTGLLKALEYYFIGLALGTVVSMAELMILSNGPIKKPEIFVIVFFDIIYNSIMFIPFWVLIFSFTKANLLQISKLYLYFNGIWHIVLALTTFIPRVLFHAGLAEGSSQILTIIAWLLMALIFGNMSSAAFNRSPPGFWMIFVIWIAMGSYFGDYYQTLVYPVWDRLSG